MPEEIKVSISIFVIFLPWSLNVEGILARLIIIYECKIELKWTGTASDGTEVEGTLSIPEVSHEITLDGISKYSVGLSI